MKRRKIPRCRSRRRCSSKVSSSATALTTVSRRALCRSPVGSRGASSRRPMPEAPGPLLLRSRAGAMHYADRLEAAIEAAGNPCLVGLDPHLDALPEEFAVARNPDAPRSVRAAAVAEYLAAVIELA